MNARTVARHILTPPLIVLAVILVLFEEVFWHWMIALGDFLARHVPLFDAMERLVARLSPVWVCVIFTVPLAIILPMELTAMWLLIEGQVIASVTLAACVKVIFTVLSARLFTIAKPKLMQVRVFAWSFHFIMGWTVRAHAYVDGLPAWQAARRIIRAVRQWITNHRQALMNRGVVTAIRSRRPVRRPRRTRDAASPTAQGEGA